MMVTTDSTAWVSIEIEAIANFKDSIIIEERTYSESEKCFTRILKMQITSESAGELLDQLKHMNSECDWNCKYCFGNDKKEDE